MKLPRKKAQRSLSKVGSRRALVYGEQLNRERGEAEHGSGLHPASPAGVFSALALL